MSDIATKLITMADNTPAVAEAVNGAKSTVSGSTVRVDDVMGIEHPLQVQTTAGAKVTVVGKNLLSVLTEFNETPPVYNAQPIYMKKGDRFIFSHNGTYRSWALLLYGTQTTGEPFPHNGTSGYEYTNAYIGGFYTTRYNNSIFLCSISYYRGNSVVLVCSHDCIITGMQILPDYAVESEIFTQYQLEPGTIVTEYEPYKTPQIATADNTGKVEGLRSVSPTMTMMVDHGAEVQCTYFPQSAADTYAKYLELKQAETDLQDML